MSGPVRIQLKRTKGWRMPENTVKVTRPRPWGNPYKVGAHPYFSHEMCVSLFETLVTTDISDEDVGPQAAAYRRWFREHIHELRGKNLACWCKLPELYERDRCHGAVLLTAANAPSTAAASRG